MNEMPRRRTDLDVTEVEDGLVVFDATSDLVHYLDPLASMIFIYCDGTRTPQTLAELAQRVYQLEAAPLDEINTAVSGFSDRGLLR
jgi:hypothetical protein